MLRCMYDTVFKALTTFPTSMIPCHIKGSEPVLGGWCMLRCMYGTVFKALTTFPSSTMPHKGVGTCSRSMVYVALYVRYSI